jgi:hypothetical protein
MPLLEAAMMLPSIYYFMSTTVNLTNASKIHVEENLRRPTIRSYNSSIASRLLNRQLKASIHALRYGVMREVLQDLESELRMRRKAMWATCFCVAVIICTCIEEAQTAMDAFAMYTGTHGNVRDRPSSDATIDACRQIDDALFVHLFEDFHGTFKTHQPYKPHSNKSGYNPIRDGPRVNEQEGFDQHAVDLVNEIRQIITNHGAWSLPLKSDSALMS